MAPASMGHRFNRPHNLTFATSYVDFAFEAWDGDDAGHPPLYAYDDSPASAQERIKQV